MPIIPIGLGLIDENYTAVRLARYAQLTGIAECGFWGVGNTNEVGQVCKPILSLFDRKQITRYLAEAQEEIERVAGYPMSPRWFTDELPSVCGPLHVRRGKLIEFGIRATSVIAVGSAVNHAADPAVIGPIATTVTDTDEVHIYHPGTDIEIDPSSVVIAAGNVTISIPRCRLVVDPDNPDTGWDYTDTAPGGPFEQTVDVTRVYNDDTTQATLVWPHHSSAGCSSACGCLTCDEYTHSACGYIRDGEGGLVDVLYADQSERVWTPACSTCYCYIPEIVRLYYRAGLDPLTKMAEEAIVRLAHAKMPPPTCTCDEYLRIRERDSLIPKFLDRERLNCPFGMSDGAWTAYQFVLAMAVRRVVSM